MPSVLTRLIAEYAANDSIELLKLHEGKIDWNYLTEIPTGAIRLLEPFSDKINWSVLRHNPNKLEIVTRNIDSALLKVL